MSKLSETIRQAKLSGGLIITTHAAFIGFNDLHDFLKEASDNDVTVTFAPLGKAPSTGSKITGGKGIAKGLRPGTFYSAAASTAT